MNLASKNLPLEESINKMKTALESVGCETTFAQEKHPLENCFSVNLASVEAPKHIYSNGKGIYSQASVASAYGEYIERLQTNNFFIDFYLPQRKYYPDEVAFEFGGAYLNKELNAIYNPNGELILEDLIDYNSDYTDKIVALPFIKQSNQEKIYIPINILSNLYVSNGLATGNTPHEAKVQALSEIFERYAKIQIIKKGYALPKFPQEILETFPKVFADVKKLRELGYIVEVLDASLNGQFPVTAISLINPKNSTLFVSFGAHPILEVSLERTMTELMQGRDIDKLDDFAAPTFDMSIVSDSFNIESHFIDSTGKLGFKFLSAKKSFEFAPWKYKGKGSVQEYDFLLDILNKMDKEIYLREYSYLGFYSCQMIVPEVSEVYPIEDLTYNNKNSGKWIRDMVLNFENYDTNDILDAIETLDDSLDIEAYIGVIFKNNFTLGEFKAQLFLSLAWMEEARQQLQFSNNKIANIISELIRMHEAELNWDDYETSLYDIYGKAQLDKAIAILEGRDLFIDRTLHPNYTNMLDMFDRVELKKQSFYSLK